MNILRIMFVFFVIACDFGIWVMVAWQFRLSSWKCGLLAIAAATFGVSCFGMGILAGRRLFVDKRHKLH